MEIMKTVSKACGCMLELCQAGEIIVGNVFNGESERGRSRQALPIR